MGTTEFLFYTLVLLQVKLYKLKKQDQDPFIGVCACVWVWAKTLKAACLDSADTGSTES